MQVLTKVIKHGSPALQLRATDVMLSAIQHDPAPLRQFMRSQKDHELFHLLVRCGWNPVYISASVILYAHTEQLLHV